MKRILITLLYLTAPGLRAATPEEAKQVICEFIEARKKKDREGEDLAKRKLDALGPEEKFTAYYELLAERMDDFYVVGRSLLWFGWGDGKNMASAGRREAIGWTRKVLEVWEGDSDRWDDLKYIAGGYLALKGNENELEVFRKFNLNLDDVLRQRIAGTNVIGNFYFGGGASFVPSVTNTGPQAVYAEALVHRFWDGMKEKDASKIPAELQTMVVWFDEAGNPACNVDLAKYGLSMPVITPKPTANDPYDIKRTVTFPQPRRSALPVNILIAAALVIITLIALRLLRRRSAKNMKGNLP